MRGGNGPYKLRWGKKVKNPPTDDGWFVFFDQKIVGEGNKQGWFFMDRPPILVMPKCRPEVN